MLRRDARGVRSAGFPRKFTKRFASLVAGLLTLGDVEFKGGGGGDADIVHRAPLVRGCDPLAMPAGKLEELILVKNIFVGIGTTVPKLNLIQARSVRDMLSRFRYGLLFECLILPPTSKASFAYL